MMIDDAVFAHDFEQASGSTLIALKGPTPRSIQAPLFAAAWIPRADLDITSPRHMPAIGWANMLTQILV